MVDEPLAEAPEGVDEDAWAAACAAVRAYCGWHVAPVVEETVTLDGSNGPLMFLPTLRLVDLLSITNDGEAVGDPEWSANGIVRGSWTYKLRGVVAVMEHGYEEAPVEMLAVVAEMVASAGRAGVEQVTSGTHTVRFGAQMDSRQRGVLDRYRLVTLA